MKKNKEYLSVLAFMFIFTVLSASALRVQAAECINHQLEWHHGSDETCTDAGQKDYYQCKDCKQLFLDDNANTPVTMEDLVIPSYDHYFEEEHSAVILKKATMTQNGQVGFPCVECQEIKKTNIIPKIQKIELSFSTKGYNGKTQKPLITITDSQGNVLHDEAEYGYQEDGDYRVRMAKGRKTVGRYFVEITFLNRYSGVVKKSFDITPKGTAVVKLKAGKRKMTVKWKKQSNQTTGYQIQYGLSPKFKNAKKISITKNSATSKTITKLSGKKKYYVRIRTYKKVKYGGKNVNIYSGWSEPKTVKVK